MSKKVSRESIVAIGEILKSSQRKKRVQSKKVSRESIVSISEDLKSPVKGRRESSQGSLQRIHY